ncbi:ethyl tert-butyl ether degradation protein EthD [Williamsia sp. 1138]|uniref:EthD domain-containing protein n=1 Tax=Williamsia sp. 1138 TaxID=1903117 RepID=UPI000A0FB57D|nr:EthD domain-containing protein [Williamsia sp. 1138]OZG26132.1 ethyl tert-butyl ether degradation protein EthD [Williamsia sp. 1138]
MSVHLIFCVKRLETISQEKFLDYWHNVHGPLVRERAEVLGILRYEQAHPVPGNPAGPIAQLRGAPDPFDGVASLWFESLEQFQAGGSTPEGRRAAGELLEDEKRFIDLEKSPLWLADDRVVV